MQDKNLFFARAFATCTLCIVWKTLSKLVHDFLFRCPNVFNFHSFGNYFKCLGAVLSCLEINRLIFTPCIIQSFTFKIYCLDGLQLVLEKFNHLWNRTLSVTMWQDIWIRISPRHKICDWILPLQYNVVSIIFHLLYLRRVLWIRFYQTLNLSFWFSPGFYRRIVALWLMT